MTKHIFLMQEKGFTLDPTSLRGILQSNQILNNKFCSYLSYITLLCFYPYANITALLFLQKIVCSSREQEIYN